MCASMSLNIFFKTFFECVDSREACAAEDVALLCDRRYRRTATSSLGASAARRAREGPYLSDSGAFLESVEDDNEEPLLCFALCALATPVPACDPAPTTLLASKATPPPEPIALAIARSASASASALTLAFLSLAAARLLDPEDDGPRFDLFPEPFFFVDLFVRTASYAVRPAALLAAAAASLFARLPLLPLLLPPRLAPPPLLLRPFAVALAVVINAGGVRGDMPWLRGDSPNASLRNAFRIVGLLCTSASSLDFEGEISPVCLFLSEGESLSLFLILSSSLILCRVGGGAGWWSVSLSLSNNLIAVFTGFS